MNNVSRRTTSGSPYEAEMGFSRAAREGNVVAVSGTAPLAADGTAVAPGDAGAQARRCLEIIRDALAALGASLDHVIRTRIYLIRIEDWTVVAPVHGEVFGGARPATTVVQVGRFIDPEWLVEIEADAVVPNVDDAGNTPSGDVSAARRS
jgi:enamine deaminase RidA (YjgF/YER057c/UK114 family)